jgi:acetylornithine deacetylase
MKSHEKEIVAAVDGLREDIIDFTLRLVREKSTLNQESGAVAIMEAELVKLGFQPQRIPIDEKSLRYHPGFAPVLWEYQNKDNILALIEPETTGGKSLLFNGHLDVVSAEPVSFWDHDPYVPEIKEGWISGRGAGDMKSGVAAMTYGAYALQKAGFSLAAPLTIEAVVEEECSGNGALACMAAGFDADAVLIPEPFGPTITTCQLGVLWFKVVIKGKPVHVLEAGAGSNSVEKAFPIIAALRELEIKMNGENIPEPYRAIEHPINLNVGIIQGGDWASTVPALTEFHARLSYFPGTRYDDVCKKIIKTVDQAAQKDPWLKENMPEIEFYGFRSDGHCTDKDLDAYRILNQCHREFSNDDAAETIATCTTDLRAFHFFGKSQATCYGPVAENIHGTNERVNIDSIIHTAKTYALFAARWCGIAEN